MKYYVAKTVNTSEAWNNNEILRNRYKTKIKFEKNQFINKSISKANNQKLMWKN